MAKVETVYKTVTMDDGRVVEFAGKRQMLKTSDTSSEGVNTVRLDFVNGETRIFTIPDELLNRFALHGAEQKLGDEIAGLKDIEDSILAIDDLMDRLARGEWGVKREANGMAGTSVLARALVESTGKDIATIREFLGKKTHAEKVALRQNPRILPIVQRLEAEKVKKASTVDTDSLLGELDGGTEGDEQEAA